MLYVLLCPIHPLCVHQMCFLSVHIIWLNLRLSLFHSLSLLLSLSSSLCLSLSLYLSFSLFLTFCLPSSPTYLPPSSPLLSFFLFSYHPFFLHSFIPSPLLLLTFFFLIYSFPTLSPYTGGAEAGMVVCKIGGPAYRIGMGGGAASSR